MEPFKKWWNDLGSPYNKIVGINKDLDMFSKYWLQFDPFTLHLQNLTKLLGTKNLLRPPISTCVQFHLLIRASTSFHQTDWNLITRWILWKVKCLLSRNMPLIVVLAEERKNSVILNLNWLSTFAIYLNKTVPLDIIFDDIISTSFISNRDLFLLLLDELLAIPGLEAGRQRQCPLLQLPRLNIWFHMMCHKLSQII